MPTAKKVRSFITNITQRVALPFFALLVLVSCGKSYDEVKAERAKAVNASNTINIAVIWDKMVTDFMLVEGIMQAVDEINEKGGVFGRKIKIKVFYSEDDADEQELARKVARDTSFAAVIGHRNSINAIPASVTYEYYGLLFVAPSASNYNLTNHGFGYTFRTIQSDSHVGSEIAVFMKSQGHKQIAIIDDRSVYGKGLADGVTEALSDVGLIPVLRRHYSPGKTYVYRGNTTACGGFYPRSTSNGYEAACVRRQFNGFKSPGKNSRQCVKRYGGAYFFQYGSG
jgi:hypothetical protein